MRKIFAGLLALCVLAFQPVSVSAADAPPVSAASKNVEALVNKAAAEIEKRGKGSFDDFHKKGSEWLTGETYIFVYNLDGVLFVNGAFPENERRDPNRPRQAPAGFVADFLKMVKANGQGWVSYEFTKPGETKNSRKWSYVKKVIIDGEAGLVGAGFYPQ